MLYKTTINNISYMGGVRAYMKLILRNICHCPNDIRFTFLLEHSH